MAVPKSRHSSTKRNMRRSHHALKRGIFSKCPRCGAAVPSHMACPQCGTYKGREVVNVLKKINKQERKRKQRAADTAG